MPVEHTDLEEISVFNLLGQTVFHDLGGSLTLFYSLPFLHDLEEVFSAKIFMPTIFACVIVVVWKCFILALSFIR